MKRIYLAHYEQRDNKIENGKNEVLSSFFSFFFWQGIQPLLILHENTRPHVAFVQRILASCHVETINHPALCNAPCVNTRNLSEKSFKELIEYKRETIFHETCNEAHEKKKKNAR